jgi:thiamine kinase-like enzyme
MSEYTTPISTAFELQRTAIKQSQEAFERSLALQRDVSDAMLDGLDGTEEGQRATVELAHRSILAYLDAVEASVPGSAGSVREVRRTVDEQFEELLATHAEAFDAAEEEWGRGADSYEELTQDYLDAVEDQLDLLLQAHEDLERTTVETIDRTLDQYETMQEEMDAQAAEFQEQFEAQTSEFQEQFEAQLERFREQFEEMQGQLEELQTSTTQA